MPDRTELVAAKRAARADVRRTRATRSTALRQRDDQARATRVLEWLDALAVSAVAGYLSADDEPGSTMIIDVLAARGVRVLLPVSVDGEWAEPGWATYQGPDRVRRGPRSIAEPVGPVLEAAVVADVDVVLCPGLAGTPEGDRLGRGGGWYDRVLPLVTGPVVLLLNDDEIVATLPTGPLDRRVDLIATPTRVLTCRSR